MDYDINDSLFDIKLMLLLVIVVSIVSAVFSIAVSVETRDLIKQQNLARTIYVQCPDHISKPKPKTLSTTKPKAFTSMTASTYSDYFEGRRTASGATYRGNLLTAASNRHKLGSVVSVSRGGNTVRLVINDRLHKLYSHRIDLSKKAWNVLSKNAKPGLMKVKVTK